MNTPKTRSPVTGTQGPCTHSLKIRQAVEIIHAGGIVAYPTEAVFGLGCDPMDNAAVARILRLKRRRQGAGLILIAADPAQLEGWIAPSAEEAHRFVDSDAGVTWIMTAGPAAPDWITGGRGTVAVRVTHHPVAAALCAAAGMPLVSTSANTSGSPPARSALRVRSIFGRGADYVLPGATGGHSRPSSIRDARTGEILRAG